LLSIAGLSAARCVGSFGIDMNTSELNIHEV
jgi:hypothetical protein